MMSPKRQRGVVIVIVALVAGAMVLTLAVAPAF